MQEIKLFPSDIALSQHKEQKYLREYRTIQHPTTKIHIHKCFILNDQTYSKAIKHIKEQPKGGNNQLLRNTVMIYDRIRGQKLLQQGN